ncbi:ArsR/SmtB family transcription factor [Aquirufa sp. ROCK2-A2]
MIELIAKAIGDESRKKIIELLLPGELAASAIFEQFNYAAPTISRHLSVLKEVGIVETRRDGVFIYYSLNKAAFMELNVWLAPFLPETEKPKIKVREKTTEPKISKKDNPFDKFQSEF